MTVIEKIDAFRIPASLGPSYEPLLEGARSGALGPAVRRALHACTGGARRLYLYEATGGEDSRLRHHECEPAVAALFPLYERHYCRIDPVCEAYRAAPHAGDMVMQRIRPIDIASSDFKRRFFDDGDIIERISIVQRGPSQWRAMNLARHKSEGYFGDRELESIAGLARLALPMMALLCAPSSSRPPSSRHSVDIDQLEARFEALYPRLPLRERQVCARAARGLNVEATALDLGIGKSSVLTYRRRAYRRLSVSSALELSGLVSH